MEFFYRIGEWIYSNTGIAQDIQLNILITFLIIFFLWLARRIILFILSKRIKGPKVYIRWKRSLAYIFLLLGALLIGRVWFEWFQSITVYLGFLSAGLAIAAKDLILDFVGSVYIIIKKPFEIGDRINVDGSTGDIIDRQFFQFIMMEVDEKSEQRTGKTVYVPNSFIFLKPFINYSSVTDFIWKEIQVQVTFDSDIEKAAAELKEIVRRNSEHPTRATMDSMKKTSKKYFISYASLTPNIYISGNENGTVLNVRFLCMPDKCRDIQHNIWRDLVKRFNEIEEIDFSYSVSRVLSRDTD